MGLVLDIDLPHCGVLPPTFGLRLHLLSSWFPICATSLATAGYVNSGLKEFKQVSVELVFVRVRESVRCTRVNL